MYVNRLTWFFVKLMRKMSDKSLANQPSPEFKQGTVSEEFIPTGEGDARVLVYKNKNRDGQVAPLFINLHGGGFVWGIAEMDGAYCRQISAETGCVVANIDYKFAPEHPFPAALNQIYAVAKYYFDNAERLNIDKNHIAMGGHSAGGSLTAAVCLKAKETGEFKLCCQILDYPALDLAREPALKTRYPKGSKIIPPWMARLFNACYVLPEDARNPLVSPIYAKDLKNLPPALVITAEQDSLAEEGEMYADMLKEAGVPTSFKMFMGVGHGFTHTKSEKADEAWALMIDHLEKAFVVSQKI